MEKKKYMWALLLLLLSASCTATVQDKNVVRSANFFFDEQNAAAAKVSDQPLELSLRLILNADKNCSPGEASCVYKVAVSAWGNDNKVRNIEFEVWMKHDESMEILSSREIPLHQENFSESIYDSAVEFYVLEVNRAARTITPGHPRLLSPRRLVKAESDCGRTGDCVLTVLFSAENTENRVMDIDLRVWRHPDGKMDLLGAEELQPSTQFRRPADKCERCERKCKRSQDTYEDCISFCDEECDRLPLGAIEAAEEVPRLLFERKRIVIHPVYIFGAVGALVVTFFSAIGVVAYRRKQRQISEERVCGTHVLI